MSIAFRAALAAVVLMSGAAFVRADDKDDIKKSGQAFAKALHEGNAKEAKTYTASGPTNEKFIDVLVPVTQASAKLTDASVAKFGDEGKTIIGGGRGPGAPQYSNSPKDFDDAQIDVQGNTAKVTPKTSGGKALTFKKEGGMWKVDVADTLTADQVDQIVAFMPQITTAMNQTTGEIKDGKYQNVADARQGFGRHVAAAMGLPGGQPGGQR